MASKAAASKRKAPEEIVYLWAGTDRRGNKVKGELRGLNPAAIKAEIRRQGIIPTNVKKKPKSFSFGDSITPKDIAQFTRQLHTMLRSGVPIVQAVDMVAMSSKKEKLKKMLTDIRDDISGGTSLSNALRKHPLYFSALYSNLVEAGEEAGILEDILSRLASYLERMESIKSKVKKAMIYPISVFVVAIGVTMFLLIYVIPTFEEVFANFGAELPAFTQMVLGLSAIVQSWWWLMIGGAVLPVILIIQARKRSANARRLFDRILLKIPLFGQLARLSATSRFARTLSTMFNSGVPLVEALESVAGATGNVVYEEATLEMREAVSIGQQLNFSMRQSNIFEYMVIQMVAIGEEAGSLGDMLQKVAEYYEEELDSMIAALMTLIEPLIIVVLGTLIGGLIVAMYLPIFQLAMTV
jgi:type IV pilus assembly protein PilC